jgi:antitoxin CptB
VNNEIPPRLRWACRRGMLELDVLLGNFLDEAYLGLPAAEQAYFTEFLINNDQDLFMWLSGRVEPTDPKIFEMVAKIREHAQNIH